jgi:[protein-PII] uridylyltransferase
MSDARAALEVSSWIETAKKDFAEGIALARASHFKGAGGLAVVKEITACTDRLLSMAFARVCSEAGAAPEKSGWMLAAVGGYGRGELNPHSDIDIMFLGVKSGDDDIPSRTLHLLWDLGLNIGYSVRSVDDCAALMKGDVTIMTSLMEARPILGEARVFEDFNAKTAQAINHKKAEEYVREKLVERNRRHKKYGDSVYLREPNIKEGAGGLRDVHAALWIARMKHGAKSLEELRDKEIIKDREYRRLRGCRDYLLRLRNELHFKAGHRQDVLTYDMQEEAARDFGYRERETAVAAENFMRAYYLRARGVREISLEVIDRTLEKRRQRKWFIFPPVKKKLDDNFFLMGRQLCLAGDPTAEIASKPETVILAYSHCQAQGAVMSDLLKDAIADAHGLLIRKTRDSAAAGRAFLEILGRLDRLHETLSDMHSLKVLGRFLPEFGAVSALVQHDFYHKYTVDEHSLLAVKKVQDIQGGEGMSYPEFAEALRRVKDKQALMLAVLLHDSGKAGGKGHAETGAVLAYKAATRMGMEKQQADKVAFLIRNHLLMDHISKRRELSDRKVVEKFCRIVDSPELLDMLYILTYADISAVGPEMFNDWKMMLLKELHGSAMAFLKDEVSSLAFEKDRLTKLRAKIASEAASKGVGKQEEVMKFLDNLPPNYVFSVPVETALRHFTLSSGIKGGDIILDHRHHKRGYTELTVILHDMMGLLYLTAGGLAAKGLNILSAQIFTGKNGIIIDTLQVTDYNKKPAVDEQLWEDVKRGLVSLLRGQARVEDMMPRSHAYPKRTVLKDVPVRVEVDNEASDKFTVVEVFAPDRVGLLYDITKELYNQGCQISSAKVDTEVDQIVDVFYVTDIFRYKLEDSDRIDALKEALRKAVS